jgi:SAM-dependent methyltransferase
MNNPCPDGKNINSAYGNAFAAAYDALMGGDYSHSRYADYIEDAFARHGAPPEPIIADLGCGTGSLCIELSKRGYDVIGIDKSPQMLSEAIGKAADQGVRNVLFVEQEIDSFELFGSVGAFVSTIDSVNYITDKRRLRRMFRLVDNYLAPGGMFIFDVNTSYKLSKIVGDKLFYEISDDVCYLWKSAYNGANAISYFDLTFFIREKSGGWNRFDETHRQRAYDLNDIETAIRGTSLSVAGVYEFLGFRRPTKKAAKANYILIKAKSGAVTYNGLDRL